MDNRKDKDKKVENSGVEHQLRKYYKIPDHVKSADIHAYIGKITAIKSLDEARKIIKDLK